MHSGTFPGATASSGCSSSPGSLHWLPAAAPRPAAPAGIPGAPASAGNNRETALQRPLHRRRQRDGSICLHRPRGRGLRSPAGGHPPQRPVYRIGGTQMPGTKRRPPPARSPGKSSRCATGCRHPALPFHLGLDHVFAAHNTAKKVLSRLIGLGGCYQQLLFPAQIRHDLIQSHKTGRRRCGSYR